MNYPKTLLVQRQGERGEKWYEAQENAKDLNDGEVAVYVLKEMKTKTTNVELK